MDVARDLAAQDLNTNAIVETIMQQARELVDADRYIYFNKKQLILNTNVIYRCALFLVDRERGELISHIADHHEEIRFRMDAGIAGTFQSFSFFIMARNLIYGYRTCCIYRRAH